MIPLEPEDLLYRRLHLSSVKDKVVTSGAYKVDGEYPWEISVDIAKALNDPRDCLRTRPFHGVGEVTIEDVMSLGLEVRHDPIPENNAHALIVGNTRAKAKLLAKHTRVVIEPQPDPREQGEAVD